MAVALSLDGFGVGLAYGLKRIRIPFVSLGVIALCTAAAMSISMLFGNLVTVWLTFVPTRLLGALIIVLLGLFQLARAIRHQRDSSEALPEAVPALAVGSEQPESRQVFQIRLRFLGLVIQVLRTPAIADMDGSGGISFRESFLLGIALAMDAFASGIGAALAGISFSVIGLVALTQLAMLRLGELLAHRTPEWLMARAEFLPGIVLIVVGCGKLI